jgi:hypothetical protein
MRLRGTVVNPEDADLGKDLLDKGFARHTDAA